MNERDDDEVAILRLHGGKANAMSAEVLDAIERLVDGFEAGPARAAVLIGYERYFSAGLALPLLVGLERAAMKRFIGRFGDVMLRVFRCARPIVAAINGHAIAGGCVLALQCDWRLMVDAADARIGLNETQLGIGLPSSVLEPLKLAVPPSSLVPIAYEGRLFAPDEARALGLVHELVAPGELEARATARARALASVPESAVAQVKLGLRRPALEAISRNSDEETERWLDTWFSPPARARLEAAVAKLTR
jgi:enoyl-CoA hydratase